VAAVEPMAQQTVEGVWRFATRKHEQRVDTGAQRCGENEAVA